MWLRPLLPSPSWVWDWRKHKAWSRFTTTPSRANDPSHPPSLGGCRRDSLPGWARGGAPVSHHPCGWLCLCFNKRLSVSRVLATSPEPAAQVWALRALCRPVKVCLGGLPLDTEQRVISLTPFPGYKKHQEEIEAGRGGTRLPQLLGRLRWEGRSSPGLWGQLGNVARSHLLKGKEGWTVDEWTLRLVLRADG